jgi:hypothetical protein
VESDVRAERYVQGAGVRPFRVLGRERHRLERRRVEPEEPCVREACNFHVQASGRETRVQRLGLGRHDDFDGAFGSAFDVRRTTAAEGNGHEGSQKTNPSSHGGRSR